jgi:hypothetical protein
MGDLTASGADVAQGFNARSNVISLSSRWRRQVRKPQAEYAIHKIVKRQAPDLVKSRFMKVETLVTPKVLAILSARPPANDTTVPTTKPVSLVKLPQPVSLKKAVSLKKRPKASPVPEAAPVAAPVAVIEPTPVVVAAEPVAEQPKKRATLTLNKAAAKLDLKQETVHLTAVTEKPHDQVLRDRSEIFRAAALDVTTPAAEKPVLSAATKTEGRPTAAFTEGAPKKGTLRLKKDVNLSGAVFRGELRAASAQFKAESQAITAPAATPGAAPSLSAARAFDSKRTQKIAPATASKSLADIVKEAEARGGAAPTPKSSRLSDDAFKSQFRSLLAAVETSSPQTASRDAFIRTEKPQQSSASFRASNKARRGFGVAA